MAFETTILILIWFVAILINGLNELIKAGFDFSILWSGEFWYNMFSSVTTNLLIFFGTFFYLLRKRVKNDPYLISRDREVKDLVNNKVDPNTFDLFFPRFKRERKKNAYRHYMRKVLNKWEKKNNKKHDSRYLWSRYLRNPDDPAIVNEVEQDEYCRRKKSILEQMDEDYIEEHIDEINVKYKELSKMFIMEGYDKGGGFDDGYNVESKFAKIAGDLAPRLLLTFSFLFALHSLYLETQEAAGPTVITGLLLALIPMILQAIFAVLYTDQYINEKILADLRTRRDVLIHYLNEYRPAKEVE